MNHLEASAEILQRKIPAYLEVLELTAKHDFQTIKKMLDPDSLIPYLLEAGDVGAVTVIPTWQLSVLHYKLSQLLTQNGEATS